MEGKIFDPLTAYTLRERIAAAQELPVGVELTQGDKGLIVRALDDRMGGTHNRHLALGWLLRGEAFPLSTKELSPSEWASLWRWVGAHKEEGLWETRPEFPVEAALVVTEAIRELNQIPFRERRGFMPEQDLIMTAVQMNGIIVIVVPGEQEEKENENGSE